MELFELSNKSMNSCGTSTLLQGSMNTMLIDLNGSVYIWHSMNLLADITALSSSSLYVVSSATFNFTKQISFLSEL